MRNNKLETNVINLKKRKQARKYRALYGMLTRIKTFICSKFSKPNTLKNYRKTINH